MAKPNPIISIRKKISSKLCMTRVRMSYNRAGGERGTTNASVARGTLEIPAILTMVRRDGAGVRYL